MKFICDMSIFQIYLVKWGEKRILATPLSKFWEKVKEKREKWCNRCEREKKEFQRAKKKKIELWQLNYRNWRIKKWKKRKLNCDKSNATAVHYFSIFFTNCCYSQFLTDFYYGLPIISLFYLLIITHYINCLWKFL